MGSLADFCFMACDAREADVVAILLVGVQDFSVLYKELEAQKWHSEKSMEDVDDSNRRLN